MASPEATRRETPRAWRWGMFFVVLAVLAVTAMILPIVYNLNQQLRPEELRLAQQRWWEGGPSDYDLSYSIQYDRERLAERHVVLVREGQIVWASCEGELVAVSPTVGAALGVGAGAGSSGGRDIPSILAYLKELLRDQEQSQGRNFLVVAFDPKTGWPRRFVRRVRGSSTREEWNLRVWEAGALERMGRR